MGRPGAFDFTMERVGGQTAELLAGRGGEGRPPAVLVVAGQTDRVSGGLRTLSNCPSGPVDPVEFLEVVGRGRPLTRPSAPFIAVPTTAGVGAEVTRNAVLKCGPQKVSMRSPFMVPATTSRHAA